MKTTVGVIFGGRSTEHEISVISANQAMHAIDADKYDVVPLFISKEGRMYTGKKLLDIASYRNIPALLDESEEVFFRTRFGDHSLYAERKGAFSNKLRKVATIDVVVPVLHGANGEDGAIQGLFRTIGIPYAGCNIMASANGMDKITMKLILRSQGIPVVDFIWFTDKKWFENKDAVITEIEEKLGYPVIVKPSDLGSSVGIGRADNRNELEEKVADAEKFSSRIIVERMVEDLREINCSVLGDADNFRTSVLEEPIKSGAFLSYSDKYMGGSKGQKGMQASAKRIPADLTPEMAEKIARLSGETFRVLDCQGVSRVDVMVDNKDGSVYVNEINTIPGSLSFYLWEATGISFTQLMDELISLAFKRKREEGRKTLSFDNNIFAMGGAGVKSGVKGAKA